MTQCSYVCVALPSLPCLPLPNCRAVLLCAAAYTLQEVCAQQPEEPLGCAGLAWHPHAGAPGQPDTAPILATGSADMSARLWSASGDAEHSAIHDVQSCQCLSSGSAFKTGGLL